MKVKCVPCGGSGFQLSEKDGLKYVCPVCEGDGLVWQRNGKV